MKKLVVYLDTSVIGGCFDKEFKIPSLALFDKFEKKEYIPAISTVVLDELVHAPIHIQDLVTDLENLKIYELNAEIKELSKMYIHEKIVTPKYSDDALHIATATFYSADVLVSWNFKHIVNLNRIRLFNSVNIKQGYKILEIRNPEEVIHE